ncbi:MAG: hypothetical protein C4B58_06715 [Deltaproteobacteria bacterium]|nr:MAG: hypothetical protein C4B58_06715 [Deltaproteobacteria bacterium]
MHGLIEKLRFIQFPISASIIRFDNAPFLGISVNQRMKDAEKGNHCLIIGKITGVTGVLATSVQNLALAHCTQISRGQRINGLKNRQVQGQNSRINGSNFQ